MLVEQIPVNNELRNYMYLVACPDSKMAAAIDPLDHAKCLQRASDLGWKITHVINTHEHWDHTGGNTEVIAATGAKLYVHHAAIESIANVDVGLEAGDSIHIGESLVLKSMDTPGHTFCHTCLYFDGNDELPPAIFSGDTLFNAGVGNCHNGGDADVLYDTFVEQLFLLPATTQVYPGHDYIANNLQFTLSREPNNQAAISLYAAIDQWTGAKHFISNLALEKATNAFFRLANKSIIDLLQRQFADFPENPSEREVFIKLRQLRDKW